MKPHPTGIKVMIIIAEGNYVKAGDIHTTGEYWLEKNGTAYNLCFDRDSRVPYTVQELTDVPGYPEGGPARFFHPVAWMIPVPPDDSEFDYEESMDWKHSTTELRRLLRRQKEAEHEF